MDNAEKFTYDYDPHVMIECSNNPEKEKNVPTLKYKTIEFDDIVIRKEPRVQSLAGKKIGIYPIHKTSTTTSRFRKKRKNNQFLI